MPRLYFEDFPEGEVVEYGDRLVSADEIVEFARAYDPQPFHLDAEAAADSQAGELIASGWHTVALTFRMSVDAFIADTASQGAPGIDEIKWLKPVRPGDRLRVRLTTLGARVSASRPNLGIVRFQYEAINQHDEIVMRQTNSVFISRRAVGEA